MSNDNKKTLESWIFSLFYLKSDEFMVSQVLVLQPRELHGLCNSVTLFEQAESYFLFLLLDLHIYLKES